jgi:cytochrome b
MHTAPAPHAVPQVASSDTRPPEAPFRRVADAPMRMFHWLFALSFVGAYLTAESEHWRLLHVTLGYVFAGLFVFRLAYGLLGPRQSRLSVLWRKLGAGPAWLRSVRAWRDGSGINWRQGQNLALAGTVVAMLVLVMPLTLSGYATHHDWGDVLGGDWLEEVHEFFSSAFLWMVGLHLGLIVLTSLWLRQNQALPMLNGKLPGKGPSPVQHNRAWLAIGLLLAVLAFGAWQWHSSPQGVIPGLGANAEADHDDDGVPH